MKQCRICTSKNVRIDEEDGYVDNHERGIGPHIVVWYHTCEECGYREQSIIETRDPLQ